ncbi:MAG TPA: class I SAM-dependent methyltransferase [Candidatus Cybelea sp.]
MMQRCEICAAALAVAGTVPGYQAPDTYTILRCDVCNTMVSSPKRLETKVYEAIYAVPGGPPGYDRNFQYAKAVKRTKNPLAYLMSRQDAFWGVIQLLRTSGAKRILEAGSGLGYFTYALRRAGYDAVGIDVSAEAVTRARREFGDLFRAESIESYAASSSEKFDAVVMVEVIEHLEEPIRVLESALRLLAPGGSIIVSTPNRSFFGYEAKWTTDLPPVHLWWFSEDSITAMARRLRCISFAADFTAYNRKYPILHTYESPLAPMFDSDGSIIRRENGLISLARRFGVLHEAYWLASCAAGKLSRYRSARRPTLVAAIKAE